MQTNSLCLQILNLYYSSMKSRSFGSTHSLQNIQFMILRMSKWPFILFLLDYSKLFNKHSDLSRFQIALTPIEEASRDQEQPKIQWAGWVPRTNSLVFVYENDIYYKPDPRSSRTFRITKTGQPGVVYHGIPDWLYEGKVNKSDRFDDTYERVTLLYDVDNSLFSFWTFSKSSLNSKRKYQKSILF